MSAWSKVRKRVGIALGVLLLSPAVVLVLALLALQFPPVRSFARDQLLGLLADSLQGKVEVDDLRWPSFSHVELSGVRLKDRHGTLVANVGLVSAHIDFAPLLAAKVHLTSVQVDGLFLDFATPGTDRGLLSVFESKEPAKPPEPDEKGSSIAIQIDRACLEGTEIRAKPQPDLQVGFERFDGCAMFAMADEIEVRLDRLRGQVRYNGKPALAFIDEAALRAYDAAPPTAAAASDPRIAQAFLNGKLTIAEPRMGFDGRLEVRNVNKRTFEAASVDAAWLTGAADASVTVRGDVSHMAYTLELRAPESRVRAEGEVDPGRKANVRITSDGLALAKFTTIAIERGTFVLQVDADLARAVGPRIDAKLESGTYGAWPLPVAQVRAELGPAGAVNVPQFEARYPAAVVHGQAKLGAGGALDAGLKVNIEDLGHIPPLADALRGWKGKLVADADLSRPGEAADISLRAHAALTKLLAPSPALAADVIDLKLTAKGQPDRPAITANLSAAEIAFQDQRIAELQLAAAGGPDEYRIHGRADGDRGTLDVWLKPRAAGLQAGGQVQARLSRGDAIARVERVELISGQSLRIQRLRVEHLGATLTADGSLGLAGKRSQIKLEAQSDDLSALTHEFAGSDLPGKLHLSAAVSGELAKPAVDLTLDFREGPRLAGARSALALRAQLDGAQSKAKVTARGSAGKAVVRAALDSHWGRGAPLSAAVDGHHELELTLERLAIVELLRQSDTALPWPLAGVVGANIKLSGNRKQLEVKSEIAANVTIGAEPELRAKVLTEYGGGGLSLNAQVDDVHGNLLAANWHQETRLEGFVDKPPQLPEWLGQTAWEASVELASRRINELPTVRTQALMRALWPLRAEASIQLSHKAGVEPEGDIKLNARWDPWVVDPARATCTERVKPSMELEGKLREGLFVSELRSVSGDKRVFSLKTELKSLLEGWLEGQPLQVSRARLVAEVNGLDLAEWPVACEKAAGVLSARFSATDMFDTRAKFQAKLNGERIVVGPSLPFDFETQAQALPSGMDVSTRIDRIGGFAVIKGSVPISVYVHDPATSVDPNGNLSLQVNLTRADAKSLLALVPAVARPSGQFEGQIKVYGTLSKPRGAGEIHMKDVSLTLPRLGQRFTKVTGTVTIADNRVRIPELEVRDQGGRAKFRAELALESTDKFQVDLSAKFANFPVRKQGVLIGRADANAKVHVDAKPAQSDVEVRLSGVSVNLTGDAATDVQSLDAHPEIVVAGEEPPAVDEEEEAEAAKQAPIVNIYVRSDEPLWIRRDDFAIRMRPDLGVHIANGIPQISGEVKLERGYIALLGQQFDVKAGRVVFTGGEGVNPSLELTAQATSPSGKVVRVEVTGFVNAPQLAFFVDDQGAEAGEALVALAGHGDDNSEESAEDQIASAAMGMTTGLLSLGARREFGDYIPMLSLSQTTEDTRVRAGFEMDKVIPKFMRGFVRGAYVEGVVSTGNEDARGENTSGNAQGGVLIELMLPSDLVWAGKYGPGETWSVDLDWRP